MAQRLATEYVKASLTLTETEMTQLERMLMDQGIVFRVKVLDNGSQQLVFHEDSGSEVIISFEHRDGIYVSEGSYRLNTMPLANIMRKAVSAFKGNAIVNRIYSNFTMVYYYERGTVVKIVELNEHYQKTIYEYRNTVGRLEQLYNDQQIEYEIMSVRDEINRLLDERNHTEEAFTRSKIDIILTELTYRLFVLEA
ncbi:MAG: non-ribosomal peptide synthetase module [Paenibacillaceae bacterium]